MADVGRTVTDAERIQTMELKIFDSFLDDTSYPKYLDSAEAARTFTCVID